MTSPETDDITPTLQLFLERAKDAVQLAQKIQDPGVRDAVSAISVAWLDLAASETGNALASGLKSRAANTD